MTNYKPLLVRFYPDERRNLKKEARKRKLAEADILREFARSLQREET